METFQVLAFDRKGGRWRRGECLEEDAGARVRSESLMRERLVTSPGQFVMPVRAAGGVEVIVEWQSTFRSAGVAFLALAATGRVLACLLLTGLNKAVEETVAQSVQEEMGVVPGHPLCPAFATVRRERRRPLLVSFRIGDVSGGTIGQALLTTEAALARAYFEPFGIHVGDVSGFDEGRAIA